ncbi:uncharacterized protein LOC143031959 [Oratosquilla oratoria]|uniref:uncharacterized protein LOC143031959 n=1 Tax=Oratosquilla oratoria TaxID=337810 RepID=UPI003F75C41D
MTKDMSKASTGSRDESPQSFITLEPYSAKPQRKNRNKEKSSPGHQDDKTGVKNVNENLRVIFSPSVGLDLNYKVCYETAKNFGPVERMKLKVSCNEQFFNLYITYEKAFSAQEVIEYIKKKEDEDLIFSRQSKLLDVRNIDDEDGDFIPKISEPNGKDPKNRKMQIPIWHIATYKEGQSNLIKAWENLEEFVGSIPDGNIKKYGKKILIKAVSKSQAILLSSFKDQPSNVVEVITPHRSFNTARGVVYCKDLCDFDEEEILRRCPDIILAVKKLKGINGAIQLTFHSPYLPDYVKISRLNLQVKKFKARPMQCHHCFDFGHIKEKCPNNARCYICSGMHALGETCEKERFCFHCRGGHSPNWRHCPIYKFEGEVLETAANEHISFAAAKYKLKRNKNPLFTYADAAKKSNNDPNVQSGMNKRDAPVSLDNTSTVHSENTIVVLPTTSSKPSVLPTTSSPSVKQKTNISKSKDGFWTPP